jgi:hypothetical protein
MSWNSVSSDAAPLFSSFRSRAPIRALWVIMGAALIVGCANRADSLSPDSTNVYGVTPPVMVIMSPSHPTTIEVDVNDKLSQNLRWNIETQTLSAHVTYSLVDGGGDSELDPSNYKTFELPFPTVSIDQKNNLFAISSQNKRVRLGHLESGIFGPKVVLNPNVRLIAHRNNGKLSAKLIVSPM